MTLVIGTDEAGYGPNLGPLVVAATAWRVSATAEGETLLAEVAAEVGRAAGLAGPPWADSKQLYKPGGGLAALERGVIAALETVPADGAAISALLGLDTGIEPESVPPEWPRFRRMALPVDARVAEVAALREAMALVFPRHGVELVAVACRLIHPGAFNRLLDAGLNKSDILSRTTLDLAASLRDLVPMEPADVWCDRHGGRKSYAALVGRHFNAPLVQTLEETAARSRYAIPADRLGIEFTVGGESRIPVALASMTAKVVRELAMAAFNAHWSEQSPGLRPTAGYPADARRWREEAEAAIAAAPIPEPMLWRRA